MNSRDIHLSKADVTELEEEFVLRALRSGWVAPLGPDVDSFEAEVSDRVGVEHALALSSGTAALHLALLALGAGMGKVVILPTLTFAASANAVVYTGAEPVFVDSDLQDGNVNADLLSEAVDTLRAEGKDVCAVMTVDLFGRPCNYEAISPLLAERNVPLIEDAAEAFGATRDGKAAGSFGTVSALSFNGNKIMTTSGGGMLLSDNAAVVKYARKLSTQAREPVPWYEHVETGYNYRLSNILAALGRAQLRRLDAMIARRRVIREQYRAALQQYPFIRLLEPESLDEESTDNFWLTCAIIDNQQTTLTPSEVINSLSAAGIEARHLWKPLHMQPMFRTARHFTNHSSERLFATGVALPSGSGLTQVDIERVIESLTSVLDR